MIWSVSSTSGYKYSVSFIKLVIYLVSGLVSLLLYTGHICCSASISLILYVFDVKGLFLSYLNYYIATRAPGWSPVCHLGNVTVVIHCKTIHNLFKYTFLEEINDMVKKRSHFLKCELKATCTTALPVYRENIAESLTRVML